MVIIIIPAHEQQFYNELHTQISNPQGSLINLGPIAMVCLQKFPDNIALISGNQKITYQRVFFSCIIICAEIERKGIKPRDRVLLFFENSIEFYIGYYGDCATGCSGCSA